MPPLWTSEVLASTREAAAMTAVMNAMIGTSTAFTATLEAVLASLVQFACRIATLAAKQQNVCYEIFAATLPSSL
ncbi:hypothetical protein PENANT_c035G08052 [Penicillium antarcticum]|uniref:Uncharacterized protein n=1 Tax=Penicillium antarcticum TaxID=416450 RepID=A0A1V6PUX3_9EURO|nr:hypothetical protein PENANT_c035G08052 [Penicillium antarcticum]